MHPPRIFKQAALACAIAAVAAADPQREDGIRLPGTDSDYQRVKGYIEDKPDADYHHASEAAYEAFQDMKFGVRVHWGPYSIEGLPHESWPFLRMSNQQRADYISRAKAWNPAGFDADEWMRFFKASGFACFAFTAKHHDGFSMFDTRTRVRETVDWTAAGGPRIREVDEAFGIMETPFRRDVVRELADAARRYGIKVDLYFSHPDWYDADFRPYNAHPLQTPGASRLSPVEAGTVEERQGRPLVIVPDPTPEETARMIARHRAQLRELLTNYGKVDMVCLDIGLGPSVWPELKETVRMMRKLQPDVMLRARGIGNYGDYYTPEEFVPGAKANTAMPWMVIYPLGKSFSYDPDGGDYKGAKWVLDNLIDAVAKGGNFMVGIGPDADGRFHPAAVAQLEEAGAWLKVNGSAIYGTRPRAGDLWRDGADVRFTRTKDGRTVFAIARVRPAGRLILHSVAARPGSDVRLLGYPAPLRWSQAEGRLAISMPGDAAVAPAYAFQIEEAR